MPLYSFGGQWPRALPWEIVVPDPDRPGERKSRTDPATFTAEEIVAAGGVAVAEPDPPDGTMVGWDGGTWTYPPAPPPPVPAEVSMFQARAALLEANLFDAVDAMIRAMPVDSLAYQAWEYGARVPRAGVLVATLAAQAGLSEQQIDNLFRAAAAVEV